VFSEGLIRGKVKLFFGPSLPSARMIPLIVLFDFATMREPKPPQLYPYVLGNGLALLPTVGLSIPVEAGAQKFKIVFGELAFRCSP
jgi:hypothetical protein